jgi:hypothetical protein
MATAAFKSKSSRNYLDPLRNAEVCAEKEIDVCPKQPTLEEKPIVPTSSFKASSREHHGYKPKGPSPGQYDIVKPMWPRCNSKQYL